MKTLKKLGNQLRREMSIDKWLVPVSIGLAMKFLNICLYRHGWQILHLLLYALHNRFFCYNLRALFGSNWDVTNTY